jgi:hypothetical protein
LLLSLIGSETVAFSDVDLGLCLDSFFRNEMQIEVGHEYSERRSYCGTEPIVRPAGS